VILSTTRAHLSAALESVRKRDERLGFVPTMGFLHEGHLSLVDLAREKSDFTTVSIFVNPLQFGAGEDLDHYPRDLERDLSLLRERGVDLVFSPEVSEMYPGGNPLVTVDPGPMARRLCGEFREGHFAGVLTVVARFFGLFRPQVACFGQKDFQQAVLIRRMVQDLEMRVEIAVGPIVREADGLAMSSRNVYLSTEERADASGLRRGLEAVQEAFGQGETDQAALRAVLEDAVAKHSLLRLQYAEVVEPDSLEPARPVRHGSVVVLAAHCGPTRLIDNHILSE